MVYPGFTALDFIGPYEVLRNLPRRRGAVRYWRQPGPITADSGVLIVGATHSYDETPSPDIVLVPGGMTTMEHARDEKVLDLGAPCRCDVHLDDVGVLGIGHSRRCPVCSTASEPRLAWLVLPMLKPFGVEDGRRTDRARGQDRHRGSDLAGIDLAMWLFGEICGEAKAKAVQLAIEYDPQPPFDSGHVSKASAATKASATALLGLETVKAHQLGPSVQLLWDAAIKAARNRRRRKAVCAPTVTLCTVALMIPSR